jgi:hypothetical protein
MIYQPLSPCIVLVLDKSLKRIFDKKVNYSIYEVKPNDKGSRTGQEAEIAQETIS